MNAFLGEYAELLVSPFILPAGVSQKNERRGIFAGLQVALNSVIVCRTKGNSAGRRRIFPGAVSEAVSMGVTP